MDRRCRDERGVALVEFALIAPILFMLVFGIYAFGRAYNAKVELTGAVREGARAVALSPPAGAATAATNAVRAAAPGLPPASLAVTVVSFCASPPAAGSNAVVRATYPITIDIPMWGTQARTITVTGVMRCGV
jgi:Flp pilus assembly protein TadG